MNLLRTLSIRKKLMLVLLLTSVATLLLSAAGFAFTDWLSRREELYEHLRAQADVIGYNSVAALTFGDTESASATLASLESEADIVAAVLFDREGRRFASYRRDGDGSLPPLELPSSRFGRIDERFFAVSTITLGDDRIGSILILSDSRHWQERRINDLVIAICVLVGALVAAFLLSRRLQRVVSEPILMLAATTRRVSEERNYGLRAEKISGDEIGRLVDDFNEMLSQIQQRDRELNQAREQLESKVQERTRELTELTRKLEHQAYHDTLTGLANRVRLDAQLRQALEEVKRYGGRLAVLGLDLDRFKNINDTLGHAVGDKLLVQVAERLSACLRKSDLLARLGGDEFCVLLPHVEESRDVALLAERLVEAMARPVQVDGYSLHVTTSIGISLYPDDGREADVMLKNADTAMYRSKELGRNQYTFFSADMNVRALRRLALENRIRSALHDSSFEVHFQPIVDTRSLEIVAVEALIRWPAAQAQEAVSPAEIISLAEECGLITAIDEWVMERACREVLSWSRGTAPPIGLAVNISPAHFIREDLPEVIAGILGRTGFPPDRLELEITESLFGAETQAMGSILGRLRKLGIELGIDDFGTAYSCLSRLKQLPLQTLKIDRSFICDLGKDPDDEAIVRTIITMAHSLNMKVVAEGIESRTQYEFVERHGCDTIQGFLIGRPMPAKAMADFLRGAQRGPSGSARAVISP
jgi:diguanylate cyclase